MSHLRGSAALNPSTSEQSFLFSLSGMRWWDGFEMMKEKEIVQQQIPCLFSQRENYTFFSLILKTWEKSGSKEKWRGQNVSSQIFGKALGWPWFQKINCPVLGCHKLLGYFRLEARGTRTSRFLRKFFLEALSARWDTKVAVIAWVTMVFRPRLGSLLPSKLGPPTALRTGRAMMKGPLHFFPFVVLGDGWVGFLGLPEVGHETNGGLLAPESLGCSPILSISEGGEQLDPFWNKPQHLRGSQS